MAENSAIAWTDNTFNPWIGCTQIAPGCDNCYAMVRDKRFDQGKHWGAGAPRRVTSPANWAKVKRWNQTAEIMGTTIKVFCASLADVCDNEAPAEARARLWDLIRETPYLTWQLLTKRPTLIPKFIPADILMLPNIWMGVTVENCTEGLKRVADLNKIECNLRWWSVEPLLEPIRFTIAELMSVSWVVIGGESGPGARPMEPRWVDFIMQDCRMMGVPVFFKQWGGNKPQSNGCEINGREIKEFPVIGNIHEDTQVE